MTKHFLLLFDASKITLIVTKIPKYYFPNMSVSKVIGNQSSRFSAMLSILSQIAPAQWFDATLITVELIRKQNS